MVESYDVGIVGAGILGISTAYHLKSANPDLSVIVIDQNPRGAMGNTAKSAALFRNIFSSPVNRILASASIRFYAHLQRNEGIDLGLRYTGYLWLCDEDLWKQFQVLRLRERQFAQSKSVPDLQFTINDLPVDDLKELFNIDTSEHKVNFGGDTELTLPEIAHGILAPSGGTITPSKLFNYYENAFKNLGGELLYRTKVKKLLYSRDQGEGNNKTDKSNNNSNNFHNKNNSPKYGLEENLHFTGLETDDGIVRAHKICLAMGTWTNILTDPVGIDVHMKPKKRQLFNIVAKSNNIPKGYTNKEERYPIFILPPDGVYIKPLRMKGNFIVGWADNLGRSFIFDPAPKAEPEFFNNHINPVLTAYLPWLKDAEVKNSWAGQYHYNTLDGNPFIFNVQNLTVVVGASGSGIMKADAIGKVASCKIQGIEKPELMKDVEFPIEALSFDSRLLVKEHLII